MDRTLLVLVVVSALLQLAAGLPPRQLDPTIEDQIREWRKRGLPEVAAFPHSGNETVEAFLTKEPSQSSSSFASLMLGKSNVANKTKYYLFTRTNPSSGIAFTRSVEEVEAAGFDPKRLTKIIAHGFGNNINSDVFKYIVTNLLKAGDYNVIGVDWGKLCPQPLYITARNNVKPTGEDVAKTIDFLRESFGLKLDDVHLIGHSLGAHVVGTSGKNVQSGQVARITGLDPAMPLFLVTSSDRIDKTDAKLVDIIHTCAGYMGYKDPLGHVDFYPNGGTDPQPGCGLDLLGTCSHGRSYQYFAESILEEGSFGSIECDSKADAVKEKCASGNEAVSAHMGFHLRYREDGVYSLKTASAAPYDLDFHSLNV